MYIICSSTKWLTGPLTTTKQFIFSAVTICKKSFQLFENVLNKHFRKNLFITVTEMLLFFWFYLPISLLPIPGKVMGITLNTRLLKYLYKTSTSNIHHLSCSLFHLMILLQYFAIGHKAFVYMWLRNYLLISLSPN